MIVPRVGPEIHLTTVQRLQCCQRRFDFSFCRYRSLLWSLVEHQNIFFVLFRDLSGLQSMQMCILFAIHFGCHARFQLIVTELHQIIVVCKGVWFRCLLNKRPCCFRDTLNTRERYAAIGRRLGGFASQHSLVCTKKWQQILVLIVELLLSFPSV